MHRNCFALHRTLLGNLRRCPTLPGPLERGRPLPIPSPWKPSTCRSGRLRRLPSYPAPLQHKFLAIRNAPPNQKILATPRGTEVAERPGRQSDGATKMGWQRQKMGDIREASDISRLLGAEKLRTIRRCVISVTMQSIVKFSPVHFIVCLYLCITCSGHVVTTSQPGDAIKHSLPVYRVN